MDEANELCGDLCPDIPQGPIVIVPTLNEWGLIFTALLIGIYAVIRLKTKKGYEAEFKTVLKCHGIYKYP